MRQRGSTSYDRWAVTIGFVEKDLRSYTQSLYGSSPHPYHFIMRDTSTLCAQISMGFILQFFFFFFKEPHLHKNTPQCTYQPRVTRDLHHKIEDMLNLFPQNIISQLVLWPADSMPCSMWQIHLKFLPCYVKKKEKKRKRVWCRSSGLVLISSLSSCALRN